MYKYFFLFFTDTELFLFDADKRGRAARGYYYHLLLNIDYWFGGDCHRWMLN